MASKRCGLFGPNNAMGSVSISQHDKVKIWAGGKQAHNRQIRETHSNMQPMPLRYHGYNHSLNSGCRWHRDGLSSIPNRKGFSSFKDK